ncbi:MAG: hypothetical protein H7831_16870 [Magnetococcus sp. WYHC-3]
MTLFHILIFGLCISIGIAVSLLLSASFPNGIAFLVGLPSGFLGIFGFLRVLRLLHSIWLKWRPMRPRCREGKCDWLDYEVVEATPRGIIFSCGCGTKYIMHGRFFSELRKDGTIIPYMKHRPFGRWRFAKTAECVFRANIICLIPLIFLFATGCSNIRSQFDNAKSYLQTNDINTCDSAQLSKAMDYFIKGGLSTQPYLKEMTRSENPQDIVTAYFILATIAMTADHFKTRTTELNTQRSLSEIIQAMNLSGLLDAAEKQPTKELSFQLEGWLNAAKQMMKAVIEKQK